MVPRRLIVFIAALVPSTATASSLDAEMGKALFERQWVAAPSSTQSDDGLGPIYDARSCSACHAGGGAGRLLPQPIFGEGIVVRLGDAHGAPDPIYGFQLQTKALPGQMPEGTPQLTWRKRDGLRVPTLTIGKLNFGPLAHGKHASLRRAPSLFGIGLLARVPDSEILAQADREKSSGVSGKPAWLINGKGGRRLGRFGWKAVQPNLVGQVGSALSRDIGLSSAEFPDAWGECSAIEKACRAGPHGAKSGEVEVPDRLRDLIVAYLNSLPPPQPNSPAPRGQVLFDRIGCAACHATLKTGNGKPLAAYTDLLLHDMGTGLNDGIGEGAAKPGEWRTAPLWGLREKMAASGLLHDGRARNVAEAIRWHGGQAKPAHARFDALTKSEKADLLKFVEGL